MKRASSLRLDIVRLAIPTFGQLIAEPIFVLIDTAIVGHISDHALAGLSVGSTILLTVVGLCIFLAYGTTSHVASLIGAGRRKEGLEVGIAGLWLALIIGMLISATLFMAAPLLCAAVGAKGENLTQAVIYLQTVSCGIPGMLLVYAATGICRGLSKVHITLYAAVAGAILNTVLDYVFVVPTQWGIFGSGVATAIAQWIMGAILLIACLKWVRRDHIKLTPQLQHLKATASNASPLLIRSLALRACMMAAVMAATSMGTLVLAAYQVVNAAWNLVLNMLDAIGIAGQSLVASQLGARRTSEANTIAKQCAIAGSQCGMIIGVALIAVGLAFAGLFSPNTHIQHLITIGFVIQGIALPLAGWMWAIDGILLGAADYTYLAVTCSVITAVLLPCLWIASAATNYFALQDAFCMVMLWLVMDFIFIAGRALANHRRLQSGLWMRHPNRHAKTQ